MYAEVIIGAASISEKVALLILAEQIIYECTVDKIFLLPQFGERFYRSLPCLTLLTGGASYKVGNLRNIRV